MVDALAETSRVHSPHLVWRRLRGEHAAAVLVQDALVGLVVVGTQRVQAAETVATTTAEGVAARREAALRTVQALLQFLMVRQVELLLILHCLQFSYQFFCELKRIVLACLARRKLTLACSLNAKQTQKN